MRGPGNVADQQAQGAQPGVTLGFNRLPSVLILLFAPQLGEIISPSPPAHSATAIPARRAGYTRRCFQCSSRQQTHKVIRAKLLAQAKSPAQNIAIARVGEHAQGIQAIHQQ